MALYLRYAVRSDLGLVRTNNEDSVYAGPRLLAIADGMGGHAAGEVASKIVISTLEPLDEDRRIEDLMGALRAAVAEANRGILDAVEQRSELDGNRYEDFRVDRQGPWSAWFQETDWGRSSIVTDLQHRRMTLLCTTDHD